ncbi:hypothetical protein [Wolbachia endosymbiont (group A) of Agelastica alni]|uniref:hypothetical protein n=1 Tax=Wolbachia endosymbiont (group A) of Agelastica alni TaxID=3066130 RepID=UPI00333FAD98
MKNIFNKTNVPYYIAGTLATLTLLASVVFAAAPYIGFLAPVAALSVGLPFIIGGAVFSAVAIALSYKAISKNKTISEKDVQLAEKVEEISKKDAQLANQAKEIEDKDKTISEKEAQLAEKSTDIFNPRNQLDEEKAKEEEISKKKSEGGEIVEDSSVSRLAGTAVVGAMATGGIAGGSILELYVDNSKEGDARRGAIVDNAVHGLNTAGNASYRLVKETVNGVLYSSKYIYNHIPSTKIGFSWVSEKFSSYWDSAKNLMFGNKTDQASGASQFSSESQGNGIVIPEGAKLELSPILFDFLFREKQKMVRQFLREQTDEKKNVATQENLKTETPSQENQLNINNALRQSDPPSIDEDIFYDAESGDEKDTEVSSLKEQLDENSKAKVPSRISDLCESVKGKFNSVGNKLKNVYDTMSSAESARNWVPSLKTIGWIAGGAGLLVKTAYITVNGGLSIAGNSLNVAGNSTNGTESDALISNSSSVYYRPTDQQIKQSQIHEINKKLADTNKWYEDNYGTPKEDSLSNKGIFSSICNKVSSVWGSLGNLASGSNKDAHDRSEPQWYKDLYKSETMEEIIDGGILGNLFSPRVDNGINTSKQQGTFIDSVELKRLTKELPPSAYPNGSPRIL